MAIGASLFALLAGILSTLSPCVLPLLPLVLGAAVSEHRFGPVVLAAGLAVSFVAIGLFVATVGFSIGLDADVLRAAAALLLLVIGLVLMVPQLQTRVAVAGGFVSNWTDDRFGGFARSGLKGQFAVGLLLGAVWSPCVGPTLGAASVLAAQGKDLGQVATVMAAFGVGAALPLLLLGLVSSDVMLRWRDKLARAGQGGKAILGALLVAIALLSLTGLDRKLEALLVDLSPTWLTQLTTRF
ncbi:MAG: cytochrome c biogenesis protein CcdA [Xanthobacteraceae bacterium]|nr:MAG: cytochrome c biogenesis protein CcdA [Xanthobacteraceae bacterium]